MIDKQLSIRLYKYLWHSIIVPLLLLCATAHSQVRFSSLETLDINKGLSQSSIVTIHQDKDGFMWFGTQDGLNRYDGKKFKTFRPDPFDSTSISSNSIICIAESLTGSLYIGTRDGLNILDKEKEVFLKIKRDSSNAKLYPGELINNLLTDRKGNIWVGTENGLAIYDPKNHKFIDLRNTVFERVGLTKKLIWHIYQDKSMNMWIGTYYDGLYMISNDEVEHFIFNPKDDNSISNSITRTIFEDSNGFIWIGTSNGINKYDSRTKKITRYLYLKDNVNVMNYTGIQSIIETSKGDIFIGVEDRGLYKYNGASNSFEPYDIIEGESGVLSGKSYLSLYEDKSGVLWLGTRNEGVRKINLYEKKFMNYSHQKGNGNSLIDNNVYSFLEDSEGKIWIGTLQGISIWDRTKNIFSHIVPEKNKVNTLCDNRIWNLFQDSNGYIWVATSNGVDRYDPNSKNFKHYFTDYTDKNQIAENEIYSIKEDYHGNIWFATFWGLSVFNPKTDTFRNYYHEAKDSTSLSDNKIWCVYEDSKKNMWIGTQNGLSKYNPVNDSFKNYLNNPNNSQSISNNNIQTITEDVNGYLWLGTSLGINRFDPQKEIFTSLTMKNGLPNNVVYGILIKGDDIWFSTNSGLANLNNKSNVIRVFDYTDGIQSNEFNYPALKTKDGLFIFGGVNGITTFYPDSIKIDKNFPPIVFTDFKINFNSIKPNQAINNIVPLTKSINETELIVLSYQEKVFSIDFASLCYTSTKKIQYKYRIDEITPEWINIGNQDNLSFTGLNPGSYTLRITGTNTDGYWSDKVRVLKIVITPPWWKTKIFITFISLLFIFLIFLLFKIREASLKRDKKILEEMVRKRTKDIENQNEEILSQKERIEEQNIQLEKHSEELEDLVEIRTADLKRAKEKAEESDKLKSAFLANISHEVRTPLNAIVGFSGFLTSDKISKEDIKQYVEIIKANSDSLVDLITDIIDIAKIESDQLDVYLTRCDIYKLMNEIYLSFKDIVENKKQGLVKLYYQPDLSHESLVIKTDSFRVKQVLTNLLKNAVKYTEQGMISLGFGVKEQAVEFWVFDTGIGIPFEAQAYIFERFRKIERENEQLYSGTGLGLAISKNLVELLGGKIRFESIPNQGSRFYFTIPLV